MWKKVSFKKVISVVKLSLFITWCWPLPRDAIKLKVICAALYQYFCIIVISSVAFGLMNTIKNHLDDPLIMAKSISVLCPALQAVFNITCCRVYSTRIQYVTFKMIAFCELLKPHEEAIVQQYINRCIYFYGGSICWIYLSAVFIMTGPVTLDQPFPTNAEYPFDIYYQPLKTIVFLQQNMACLQGAAQLCMNIFMALLMWFASARFELLVVKLRIVTDIYALKKCIQEHQSLLKYTEEVIAVVRVIAVITIWLTTIALIIVGLILITDQPLSMKVQCVGIVFSGLSVVFMFTWPAEHLIHISNEVGQAVFDARWYHQQSTTLRKDMQILMMRAQKSVNVSIPCVMPSLSLSYYATFLSTIFSYFTTLRVVMQQD